MPQGQVTSESSSVVAAARAAYSRCSRGRTSRLRVTRTAGARASATANDRPACIPTIPLSDDIKVCVTLQLIRPRKSEGAEPGSAVERPRPSTLCSFCFQQHCFFHTLIAAGLTDAFHTLHGKCVITWCMEGPSHASINFP